MPNSGASATTCRTYSTSTPGRWPRPRSSSPPWGVGDIFEDHAFSPRQRFEAEPHLGVVAVTTALPFVSSHRFCPLLHHFAIGDLRRSHPGHHPELGPQTVDRHPQMELAQEEFNSTTPHDSRPQNTWMQLWTSWTTGPSSTRKRYFGVQTI